MTNQRRSVIAAATFVAVIGVVTACGGSGSGGGAQAGAPANSGSNAPKTVDLTVAIPALGIDYNWDITTAKEMGFFSDVGINATLKNFSGPPDTIAAVASGSAQFAGGVATDQTIIAHNKGTHVAIVAGENYALDEIMVKSSIESWSDVKGKTFGTAAPKSGSTLLLQRALESQGLALSDVKMRPFGTTGDRAAALLAGQVDGASLAQPFDFKAKAAGFTSLATMRDILGKYPFTAHVVNTDYASANPDVVVNYLRAIVKAQAWLADSANREKASQILSKYSEAELNLSEQTWDYVYKTAQGAVSGGAISDSDLAPVLTAAKQESGDNSLTLDGVVDTSYLNKAAN
ncbi:MAG TPA: ABC transporter substrate-binding protein [Pseudonocardiaceae bacterium]|nr:ABC transporter substrate-binding protein [Pseudonocardiaceae bacterium]